MRGWSDTGRSLRQENLFFTDEGYAQEAAFQHQLARMLRSDELGNEKTGLHPTQTPGVFDFEPGGRVKRRIDGEVLVLCSDEPQSYGSFLFRILPKIRSIRDLGLKGVPCLVYAAPEQFRDLLALCGLGAESIIQHDFNAVTEIDRAIVPCMRTPEAYLDPESLELFAELRANYGVPHTGRKLYVSRLGLNLSGRGADRIMTNEPELIARLEHIGFETIEPERMTVQDQILAFSSASLVVGPSGSGLFNSMFCHPGTKFIDIQSEPQWIHSYTGMYSSLELEYGIFIGKPDPADKKLVHRRFSVNIEALVARIRAFIGDAQW